MNAYRHCQTCGANDIGTPDWITRREIIGQADQLERMTLCANCAMELDAYGRLVKLVAP